MHTISRADLSNLLTDSSIDAIMAIDQDNIVVTWNKAAAQQYNKNSAEVLGRHIDQVFPSAKKDEELSKALVMAKKGQKSFLPASKVMEHRLHAEIHVIPLVSSSEMKGTMLVVHDVSHRIKTEEQLVALNEELSDRYHQLELATKELASLTHITTHNIKEPLRQIYTSIEGVIRSDGAKLSDHGRASFRRMQGSLSRISLLLDDLVTLSQINMLERPTTLINTGEIITHVKNVLAEKLAERHVIIKQDDICEIKAHASHIFLLLYQLLSSFIKYNRESVPEIKINCHSVTLAQPVGKVPAGDYHELVIEHNGIGQEDLDIDQIQDLFDKLSDKNHKSPVMAFAIAFKVMQAHGGYLVTQTGAGGRSAVRCYFPVH